MKIYALLCMLALTGSAHARLNDTGDAGLLARANAMALQGNYIGALDELRRLDKAVMSAEDIANAEFLQAEYMYRCGSYSEAETAYRNFTYRYPFAELRPEADFGIANCLFASGDYSSALKAYDACDAKALPVTDAADLAYRSGVCAFATGNTEKAKACFTRAAAFGSTRNAASFYLARIAYEKGDLKAARERFKSLNTSLPPADMTDFYMAQIELTEANYSKALSTARAMLRRKGLEKAAEAEMNRVAGEAAFKLGQTPEAVAFLKKYINSGAVDSIAPSALYIIGIDDYDNGRYDDAYYRFMPVTEAADGALQQSAYLYTGLCLLEKGDASAAILAFDKAAKSTCDPDVREAAFYNYAVARFTGANVPFASASDTFEEFLKLYPKGPYSDRVASYLAAGYMADSDFARALSRIDAISSPSPDILKAKQRVLYSLGLEALKNEDYNPASSYLDKAASLSKYDPDVAAEVILAQATLAQATGKHAEAAAKYQTYLRMAPKNAANRPQALYGLGYALYEGHNASGAASYFTQAEKLLDEPEAKADVLNRLGDISFAKSDFEGAAAYYAQAYTANPAAGDYATLSAARMKGYMRDYAGKLRLLDAFRKDFATSALMPDALLETTQAQISMGDNVEAVRTYRTLIEKYPQTSQGRRGYLQMAMTLLDMDRRKEAADAYRAVISHYPSSDEAAQAASLLRRMYADDGRADEYLAFIEGVQGAPAVSSDDAEELSFESAVKAWNSRSDARQLETFVQRYPKSAHIPAALGMLLDRAEAHNRADKAVSLANTIVNGYPDSPAAEKALALLASDDYAAGNLPDALDKWRRLSTKASDAATVTRARLGMMRTARDMADYATAAAAADEIMKSTAGADAIREARYTKALALDAEGKVSEAIRLRRELAKDPSDIFGAKAAFELADALNDSGRPKEALEAAQKFTRSGSPQQYWVARTFILMSDIYAAQGKTFEAREYLEALRRNYPGAETDIFMMIDSRLNDDNKEEQK